MKHAVRSSGGLRGFTLVELMVAIVIGMILTLAVFTVMATFEGRRRTLTTAADLDQAGTLAMFQIDGWVRSAGSGFGLSSSYAFGCPVYAAKSSGTQLLPWTATTMATLSGTAFAGVNPGTSGVFRLAPVLILPGQTKPGASNEVKNVHTSDVLVLMSAGTAWGQVPTLFAATGSAAALTLENTVAFSANDQVLIADQQPAGDGSISPCLLTQAASSVSASSSGALALGGDWYLESVSGVSPSSFSNTAVALAIGNRKLGRPPSFQLIGVGDHNTLYTYDLLQMSDTPLQAQAEGVFELHALYGVDTDGDDIVDKWVSPSDASSGYTLAALSDGSANAAGLLKNIKAIRVGLIMRTSLPEKEVVQADGYVKSPTSETRTLKLFSDLGEDLTVTRSLTETELHYRYRTVESTIPVRNNFL